MADLAELFTAATELPVGDRMRLIQQLWTTIPEDAELPLSPEWLEEIERRSAEIDAGLVEAVDWETVRADLFRRVGLDRGA